VAQDAAGKQVAAHKEMRFFAQAGPTPIDAPDWIRKTLTYKVGVKDGSIVEIVPPAPPKETEEKPAEATETKPAKPADSKAAGK
jgi:hypothetical protein